MKKLYYLIPAVLMILFVFASCAKEEEPTEFNGYEYTPATTAEDVPEGSDDLQKYFKKDISWQKNFDITYRYYNAEQDKNVITIREKKTDDAFRVEYLDSGEILYYKAAGNNTDYYVIGPDNSEQMHSCLEGKKFSSLSSLFMKLSEVDQNLPKQTNVLYMYDEAVYSRACHKYIQRAYSNAELTQSVYVWIDSQYGFAVKCEVYDANDELTAMWETQDFSTGSVKEEDVSIDLSAYTFAEEVG